MNHTVRPREVIIVDNTSSHGSIEIARQFPFVRLVEADRSTCFAGAIDPASKESEWIALINPDAFDPRWLIGLLASAQSNPGLDVFGGKLVNATDTMTQTGQGDAYHLNALVWRMVCMYQCAAVKEVSCWPRQD